MDITAKYETHLEAYEGGGMPELLYLDTIKDLFTDGIALDVGANIGDISFFFKSLGVKEIHAFEPNPTALTQLKELEKFDVKVHDVALSSKSEVKKLYVPYDADLNDANTGLSTLSKEWLDYLHSTRDAVDGQKVQMIDVQTKPLDDFNFSNVKIIKIDVEGHELEVLSGASLTIMKNRPILLIEVVNNPLVFAALKAIDYDVYWFDRTTRYLNLLSDYGCFEPPEGVYNFIFVPKEKVLPTLKAEKIVSVNSVQGIGDLMWVYRKIAPYVDGIKFNILITAPHPVQMRSKSFLWTLPKCKGVSFRLAQPWFYEEVAHGKYTLGELFTGKKEFVYAVNKWLEDGVQIDDIEPDTKVLWNIGLESTPVKDLPEKYLLVYASGSSRHDGTFQLTTSDWVTMILDAADQLDVDDIVFTGAAYDEWKTDEIIDAIGDRADCYKLFNEIRETMYVIQNAKYFIAYQSGLCMLSEEFGIPTFMIWSPQLDRMKTSWMRKENVEKQLFGHCYFNESSERVHKLLSDHISKVFL
jgi:FkbM family methyltransferase